MTYSWKILGTKVLIGVVIAVLVLFASQFLAALTILEATKVLFVAVFTSICTDIYAFIKAKSSEEAE